MALREARAPAFQAGNLTNPADGLHDQSFSVAARKQVESHQTEHDDNAQYGTDSRCQRHIAYSHQCQIDEDRDKPEDEVAEKVHHGIEDDAGGRVLVINILRQFHDTIRLTAQSAYGSSIVEGVARNGKSVDSLETDRRVGPHVTFDDAPPRPGIDAIDDKPYTHNRYEPVAGMAQMLP